MPYVMMLVDVSRTNYDKDYLHIRVYCDGCCVAVGCVTIDELKITPIAVQYGFMEFHADDIESSGCFYDDGRCQYPWVNYKIV